jgi:hypothetical protein
MSDELETTTPGGSRRIVLSLERSEVFVGIVSLILGAIVGWAVQELFKDPESLPLWTVLAVAIVAAVMATTGMVFLRWQRQVSAASLAAVRSSIDDMSADHSRIQAMIENSIGRQAELIPRERVYKDMACCIRDAKREVAVVTYLMADWQTGTRTFLPAGVDIPHRGEFYDAVYEAIQNPRTEYVRVWQVPHDRRDQALEVINSDAYNKKECELIGEIQPTRPDQARLVIASSLTTASFILIDRHHLFLNIDFFDPEKNAWHSPYMLFVKDATGDTFADLQSVIVRLTSHR